MGSGSFTINQGYTLNASDTEIYGEHICFGDTSTNIQSGINNTNFLYGFSSSTNLQVPVAILNKSTSSAYPNLYLVNDYSGTSQSVGMEINFKNLSTLSTTTYFIHFTNSTSVVGSIRGSGNNSSVTYSTTSDRRIKENIKLLNPIEQYNLIKNNPNQIYQYNFINDNPQNKQIGFIAQNLRNVFNDVNIVQGDENDLQDHNVPLTVDYGRMTTYLYGALKQSIIEIENLKKKNNELEEIIISIKDEIKYLKYIISL